MTNNDIKPALNQIRAELMETTNQMDPSVKKLFDRPSFELSGLLVQTLMVGPGQIDDRVALSCQSLEILDRALLIRGKPFSNTKEMEDKLIAVDYLYAQAIDQIISLDEPEIISILAGAIAHCAEAKILDNAAHYGRFLKRAALAIALHLGEFDSDIEEEIRIKMSNK